MFLRGFACVAALLFAAGAMAGVSGRMETIFRMEDTFYRDGATLEGRVDAAFEDRERGRQGAVEFIAALGEETTRGRLYQLYLDQAFEGTSLAATVGRFPRFDPFGFYALDGLAVRQVKKDFSVEFYGGTTRRIEALVSERGDDVAGVETRFAGGGERVGLDEMTATAGFRHYMDSDAGNWMSLGFTGLREQAAWFLRNLNTSGDLTLPLGGGGPDRLRLAAGGDLSRTHRVQLLYETYEPVADPVSFRDRFYELYARGRQSVLKANLLFQTRTARWTVEARRLIRDAGDAGYGAAVVGRLRRAHSVAIQARVDGVRFGDEGAASAFVSVDRPLSPHWLMAAGGVVQRYETRLFGRNDTVGLNARFTWKASRSLYVDVCGERIWNSALQDEYLFGVRLSRPFADGELSP